MLVLSTVVASYARSPLVSMPPFALFNSRVDPPFSFNDVSLDVPTIVCYLSLDALTLSRDLSFKAPPLIPNSSLGAPLPIHELMRVSLPRLRCPSLAVMLGYL